MIPTPGAASYGHQVIEVVVTLHEGVLTLVQPSGIGCLSESPARWTVVSPARMVL